VSPIVDNGVRQIHGAGIEFATPGVVRSTAPAQKLVTALKRGAGFSLEVWMAAGRNEPPRHARIVSCSRDIFVRNFTLAQQDRDLIMRLRTTRTDANALKPFVQVRNAFATQNIQHVVVTYDFSRQRVYIDGRRRFDAATPGGDFRNWDGGHYLVFGNELTGQRPWLGKLYAVTLWNRALRSGEIERLFAAGAGVRESQRDAPAAFDFSGTRASLKEWHAMAPALEIPQYLIRGTDDYLKWPHGRAASSASETSEILANVVLFVPLGLLLFAPARRRFDGVLKCAAAVVAIAALTTVSFESIQYFLPGRTSSLIDAFANAAGSALGVALHASYSRIRSKSMPQFG